MAGAALYKGSRRVDLNRAAEREARELDASQPADSKLDLKVKIMVVGMTGEGVGFQGAGGSDKGLKVKIMATGMTLEGGGRGGAEKR